MKGIDAVAVHSGKANECVLQLFAAHAFDGIAPQAFDMTDGAHLVAALIC